jgi:hypothetical protein
LEAVFNQDSSYFQIKMNQSLTNTQSKKDIANDVIGFEVVEELGKMTSGSITFYDPAFYYSKNLRGGEKFELTWGYKKRNETINQNTELTKLSVRRGQKCISTSPSWSADSKGIILYSCNFIAEEFGSDYKELKILSGKKKSEVIKDAMDALGIDASKQYVDFAGKNDKGNYVKNESNFKFLNRLAYEWRCNFKMGYTQDGKKTGMFVDYKLLDDTKTQNFIKDTLGIKETSTKFEYGIGSENPTISSYNGQHHIGDNGQGDASRIDIIDGKPVITRYICEDGKVKALTLNENKLKKFLEDKSQNSAQITSNIVSAKDMNATVWEEQGQGTKNGKSVLKVKDFFNSTELGMAPQGFGYTFNLEMLGNPMFSPPIKCEFGKGFPPQLVKDKNDTNAEINKFFIKKVSHKINAQGYKCSLEIVDSITLLTTNQVN